MSDIIKGKFMFHPESEVENLLRKGVIYDIKEDLTPFEVDVIGVQDMSFQYFATATIVPGESHYRHYLTMGAFYTIPGGDGTILTCPLRQLKKIEDTKPQTEYHWT